jgi:hypothetical protein
MTCYTGSERLISAFGKRTETDALVDEPKFSVGNPIADAAGTKERFASSELCGFR